jgi:phosphoglycolate phosphatase-like HAD superfamily hydrolase
MIKYKKIIFDLDDTLVPTHKHPEWLDGDYVYLKFSASVKRILKKIGRENCILLTYDKYGDQLKKLQYLGAEKYFSLIVVVSDILDKKERIRGFLNEYKKVLVVGDKYDQGELGFALELGIPCVCVAYPGSRHVRSVHHGKYLLVVESNKDFPKIINIL